MAVKIPEEKKNINHYYICGLCKPFPKKTIYSSFAIVRHSQNFHRPFQSSKYAYCR